MVHPRQMVRRGRLHTVISDTGTLFWELDALCEVPALMRMIWKFIELRISVKLKRQTGSHLQKGFDSHPWISTSDVVVGNHHVFG